jgi:hypothetical protein
MTELIHTIMEKTGLNQEQATKAAETAVGFIKERLPGNLAPELDKVLGSKESQGTLGNLTRKAGSMFGPE